MVEFIRAPSLILFDIVLFARLGQEINSTVSRVGHRHIPTDSRVMYDDLVQQPIPDHLLALLARLDQT